MSILDQLSSRTGDRTQGGNLRVVAQCLDNPALLAEIAGALSAKDAALLGDCAEVLTETAEARPEYVAPYAEPLAPLLAHKNTRVRWEATHALALIAPLSPRVTASLLPRLRQAITGDPSVIVRDYAVDTLGNYATVGEEAARAVYPLLKEALTAWNGKQAQHALRGLSSVLAQAPDLAGELRPLAEAYLQDSRAVTRKAAKALLRSTQKTGG